jgi:hypothetical protein
MSTKMSIIVYINSNCCEYHLNQINESIHKTYNIDDFGTSTASIKISMLHVPYPYEIEFESLVLSSINHADKVIILCSELHDTTVEFINRFKHTKICYYINGFINDTPANLWLDWFITTVDAYNDETILRQLNPYSEKGKYFDILLGQRRSHRDFIYHKLCHLSNVNIMTYLMGGTTPLQQQSSENWIWETGLAIPSTEIVHTVTKVAYCGRKLSLSQVIPISIYNQTAYSVVAETNFDNHYSFFTEKIVKPILAKRLFVVVSGQYYLHNLRKLGFMTFDGIIDESYDLQENPVVRFELAIKQIEYLINQPQEKILHLIIPIVEHNYRLMLETNWESLFLDELTLQLYQTMPNVHPLN